MIVIDFIESSILLQTLKTDYSAIINRHMKEVKVLLVSKYSQDHISLKAF